MHCFRERLTYIPICLQQKYSYKLNTVTDVVMMFMLCYIDEMIIQNNCTAIKNDANI